MNAIFEAVMACSRVFSSRMEAQFLSRLLMVSTISLSGVVFLAMEIHGKARKVRGNDRIQKSNPEPLCGCGAWLAAGVQKSIRGATDGLVLACTGDWIRAGKERLCESFADSARIFPFSSGRFPWIGI
ncbi:hypothetical protein [Arthrobacter sp. UCD-GKA]|uniref:hypothetical protein n=1 Tax=Arthrobacter sp. UCD-GKA TaxID=1913576 RepID=UPI0015878930|nr:hypothetical protein [Arthrobacter sp. UCD-GKA]